MVIWILIAALVVIVFFYFQFKHAQHKLFTFLIIALIIVGYISFTWAISGQNIDLNTTDGWQKGIGLYFVWLGNAFGNVKVLTTNAVKMDWIGEENQTISK